MYYSCSHLEDGVMLNKTVHIDAQQEEMMLIKYSLETTQCICKQRTLLGKLLTDDRDDYLLILREDLPSRLTVQN